jgi:hypothetical protein
MLLLSYQNVAQYLIDSGVFSEAELSDIHLTSGKNNAKNFSIIAALNNGHHFLIKQERPLFSGNFCYEILNEWQFQRLIENVPKLSSLKPYLREMLYYDSNNLIAVYEYLDNYQELYTGILEPRQVFPTAIPTWLGAMLAQIHRTTFNCEEAFAFVTQDGSFWHRKGAAFRLLQDRITPEMLSIAPPDYIRFISLYQRYESLEQAKLEAIATWHPCCVVHNDLNVANILVHQDWEGVQATIEACDRSLIKIIDWERCSWGDPVFDVAHLIANYIILWLSSMVIDPAMSMEESINSATITLEDVRPSIIAFTQEYLQHFPEITNYFPEFFKKLIQFIGLSLIIQTQAKIEYHKLLANSDIYALQVAKSLLCRPQSSFSSIFGMSEQGFCSLSLCI